MPKDTPVCCGVKGIVAAVARATEAGTFMGFRSGTSTGKSFGITTAISLPPPQSDDLNAPQIRVIRATPYIAHRGGMPMPTKRSAAKKKAIRTRELKSADRKAAKRKRRAVAGKAVATKLPPAVAGAQAVAQEVPPATTETPDIIED